MTPRRLTLLLALLVLPTGCEEVEVVVDRYRDMTPHEAYAARVADAGLDDTALFGAWTTAAREAIENPVRVSLPFREEGWLPPESPSAAGYRISLERGELLTVEVDLEQTAGADSTELFVDIFRVPADTADPFRPVQSTDTISLEIDDRDRVARFAYDAFRDGEFVVRIQPELLRGGRYRVHLGVGPTLAFPVDGRDEGAIQSFFGAARDAGRRSHHGVDIFAPRGTPVIAATDGTVRRANETPIGGKVVWLRDGRQSQNLYYAHLDSQIVSRGDRVSRGDTLGFVGNSGNAVTTPPHLHFGIYQRPGGPVDPFDFIRTARASAPEWPEDPSLVGGWVRIARDDVNFRDDASLRGDEIGSLARLTPLRVEGASAEWLRVRLPDGRSGFVSTRVTESIDAPVDVRVVSAGDALRTAPDPASPPAPELPPGSEVAVLGRFAGFDLVGERLDPDGPAAVRGWLPAAVDEQGP